MCAQRTPELTELLEALFKRRAHGIKPGLEAEARLLAGLNQPHLDYPVVHVAGTNGKGSVCAMLESIFRFAGRRTGLYTSPHLTAFNERFLVSGQAISDEEMKPLLHDIEAASEDASRNLDGRPITFFEFATAMAFVHFRRRHVDLAVIETGMGGRLDATTVVHPALTVITSISRDHTSFLGSSLEEIAGEKAGILKPGVPVVCGAMKEEALAVIQAQARTLNAPMIKAEDTVSARRVRMDDDRQRIVLETESARYGPLDLPLIGRHQVENAALAVASAEALNSFAGVGLTDKDVVRGLEQVGWPGRCQLLQRDPVVLLDSAHNPGGSKALFDTIQERWKEAPLGLMMGFMGDKDAPGFIRVFSRRASRAWAVPINNDRALAPEKIRTIGQSLGLKTSCCEIHEAHREAVEWARTQQGIVCIAGSIYLAGEVLAWLGHPEQGRAPNEPG